MNKVDFSVREWFLQTTSRGRLAMEKASRYFRKKISPPQKPLF
jgi:hypothetical protein